MSLETRWSEPALLSLVEVLEYTLEEHGESQYTKMRKQVMDAVLYVPQGCIEHYQQAPWNTFGEIREFEATSVKPLSYTRDNQELRSFDLSGRPISDSHRGLRILQTPNGTKKVVK